RPGADAERGGGREVAGGKKARRVAADERRKTQIKPGVEFGVVFSLILPSSALICGHSFRFQLPNQLPFVRRAAITRARHPPTEAPMPSDPEKRIQELHLTLPPAPKPIAGYKTAVKRGNLLFVSGHGP